MNRDLVGFRRSWIYRNRDEADFRKRRIAGFIPIMNSDRSPVNEKIIQRRFSLGIFLR
jgi:hypothetical protein